MSKQMEVLKYSMEKVSAKYRDCFISLMKEWDGSDDVLNSFYDLDVLTIKHNEAMEGHYETYIS